MNPPLDQTEYLKALRAEREALCAKLTEIESRLDEIDAEISRNAEPPDLNKMSPLERAVYEDTQLLRKQVAQALAEESPFINLMGDRTFPKL